MASEYRESEYTTGETDAGSFYSVNSLNTEYMELLTVTTPNELIRKFCPETLLSQLCVGIFEYLKLFLIYYCFSYKALYAHLVYRLFARIPLAVFTAPVSGGRFLLYKIIDSRQYKLDASTSVATLLWVLSLFGGLIGWICFIATINLYQHLVGELYPDIKKYAAVMEYCVLLEGLCDSVRELILKERYLFDMVAAALQCFLIAIVGAFCKFNLVESDNYLYFLAIAEYAVPLLTYIPCYVQIFTFSQVITENSIYEVHFRFRLLFPIKYKMILTFIANAFHSLCEQLIPTVFMCLLLFTSQRKRLTDITLAEGEKVALLLYQEIINISLCVSYAFRTLFFECMMFARFTNKANMVPRIQEKLLLYWMVYSFIACIILLFAGPFMFQQLTTEKNVIEDEFERYNDDMKHVAIVCLLFPVVFAFEGYIEGVNNLMPSILVLFWSVAVVISLILSIEQQSRINYIEMAYIELYADILIHLPYLLVYYLRERREPEYRIQAYNYQEDSRSSLAQSSHLSQIQESAFHDGIQKSSGLVNSVELHQVIPTVNESSASQFANVLNQNSMEMSFKEVSKLDSFAPFSENDSKDSGNEKSHVTNDGESK